ncbi:glycine zipper domain-containing protein [Phenylobacterium sp. LjRoot225]|uniref:glycine zipper domain-containing protein n=1 Tax=Phenylobacterium sp. LjRoot225 TaxID=3342285 RepID=UPI003ECE8C00
MRRTWMAAGLVAALAAPSFASARDACQQRAHDRKVTGTVLGGVGGALVGGAIGDTKGAVIGGLGGAVVGNQLARTKCDRRVVYRTRSTHRASSRGDDAAPRGCTYENRRYYDERGQAIYAPVRVCR